MESEFKINSDSNDREYSNMNVENLEERYNDYNNMNSKTRGEHMDEISDNSDSHSDI